MAMTYSSYVTTLQTMLVVQDPSGVANLNTILPNVIDYAELRCYRDLDLLNTVTSAIGTLTTGNRSFTIPTPTGGTFVVVQSVNVYTPAGSTVSNGTANPCERVSKEYLLAVTPSPTATDVPRLYADVDNATLLFGPPPAGAYLAQVYGTYRPDPLSNANQTTLLTRLFPDLFLAASMIFGSAYQRDFSSAGSDPQMPINYEQQYSALLKGSTVEEFRKKSEAPGWTPFDPPVLANPPRQ